MKLSKKQASLLCPCDSGKPYNICCQVYHSGAIPASAEALMRSRYTAYVLKLEEYLLQTWHPDTRPTILNLTDDFPVKWLALQVKHTEIINESTATVEFIARYKRSGKAESLHELSQFLLSEGRWYYSTSIP